MFITRQEMEKLDEADLRLKVFIPLFRAMKFQEVYHHHGRTLEQGKDIVMWRLGDLEERVNYAVVAKAGDINGRTTGSGSAGEVLTQIMQSFDTPYRDSVTTQPQWVDRCWVVTSGRVTTEALHFLEGPMLKQGFTRKTNFINGDKLWELISKHLPQIPPWEQLQSAATALQSLSPDHELSFELDGKHTTIKASPKPGTPPAEVILGNFPDNEAGDEARARLRKFIETGTPLELTSEMLAGFEPPAIFEQLGGPRDSVKRALSLTLLPAMPQKMRLERVCDDGELAVLPEVDLLVAQGGTKELTFSNEHQNVPWKVRMRMELITSRTEIRFEAKLPGHDVRQVLRWLKFQNALAKPGCLDMLMLTTGSKDSIRTSISEAESPNASLVKFVEVLSFIQEKTETSITFPDKFSGQEAEEIYMLHRYLNGGSVVLDFIALDCDQDAARMYIKQLVVPTQLELSNLPDRWCQVFGAVINLGPGRVFSKSAYILPEDLKAIRENVESSNPPENIEVKIVAFSQDFPLEVSFPRWQRTSTGPNSR